METNLSVFGGPTWGADSTSPHSLESSTGQPSQSGSPENSALDDRRAQVNSIRGRSSTASDLSGCNYTFFMDYIHFLSIAYFSVIWCNHTRGIRTDIQ